MPIPAVVYDQLAAIPRLSLLLQAPLAEYTRFGIGGPASLLVDTADTNAFRQALHLAFHSRVPRIVIGGGTNLIVSDQGYDGLVLRYTGSQIAREESTLVVQSGAVLQDVVD